MADLKNQRTYALVGHGGSGKTTVAETLLFATGTINRLGKIEDGTTALDYEPEEIKRRGSCQPGLANYKWKKNQHFLVDSPGDANFAGDLPYHVAAVDSVVLVIDAVDGVKPLTRKVWGIVKDADLPALVFINKMDRDRADFDTAYQSLQDMLGIKPVLLYHPIGSKDNFTGVVDLLANEALIFDDKGGFSKGDIPADLADEISAMRETMIENIAESDEALMEKYFEEGELTLDEINEGLKSGVLSGELVPVVVGAGLENKGAAMLLNAIQNLLPSPLEHADWQGENDEVRKSDPNEKLSLFIFKTLADSFAGQLSCARVMSGTLTPDTNATNTTSENKERISQILLAQGKEQSPCKSDLGPGSIVVMTKLKNSSTGDCLVIEKDTFILDKPATAPQLITFALAPKEKGDEDKVYAAVNKLLSEDITLRLSRDEESGDILLSGMGQNHIEVSVEKAKRRSNVEILLKTPKVPYRESLKSKAMDIQGRHKKQSGGRGQFGDCWIHLEPTGSGSGYEFVNKIVGGCIPGQYIPAVDKGVQEAAKRGFLAGYPLIDFKVTLYDGTYHKVDSSEMAFKLAGSVAFKTACAKAGVKLLEPVMLMTVSVPDSYMGDVIGDLSGRRGKVLGSDSNAGVTDIRAHVPMNEVLRYAPDLNSMTQGQGTYAIEFAQYEEAPPNVAEKVIAETKKANAE